MATAHLVLARTNARADTGSTLPIPDPVPIASETIATDATNKVTTAVVPADGYSSGSWSVTASGGAIWLAFGPAPDAGDAAKRWLVLDGETRSFGAQSGHKAAVKSV